METFKDEFKDEYQRKVSGEVFRYELSYSSGPELSWQAKVYRDGQLKGTPEGAVTDNTLSGEALRQYLVGYVEAMIERGLDVGE